MTRGSIVLVQFAEEEPGRRDRPGVLDQLVRAEHPGLTRDVGGVLELGLQVLDVADEVVLQRRDAALAGAGLAAHEVDEARNGVDELLARRAAGFGEPSDLLVEVPDRPLDGGVPGLVVELVFAG
ncbi:MAG: hypothetical protein ACYTGZ_20870 [Planctomycetota bacterium]|jgi:hypothetical protein